MSDSSDLSTARNNMVDGQIRPVRVNDPRIILAMRTLHRELFVPNGLAGLAYIDTAIDLPNGRSVMEPRVLARLVQLAAPRRGERALVVGCNTGYGAALLSSLGLQVTALDDDEHLLTTARDACARSNLTVTFRHGTLTDGIPDEPPFDIVLIEGAVDEVPAAVARCVARKGGRLVTVSLRGGTGQGVLAEHSQEGLAFRPHFNAAAQVLSGFASRPGFTF
jgi:protein-L-isoaspartate(D-aspartate) O-methyltransferase